MAGDMHKFYLAILHSVLVKHMVVNSPLALEKNKLCRSRGQFIDYPNSYLHAQILARRNVSSYLTCINLCLAMYKLCLSINFQTQSNAGYHMCELLPDHYSEEKEVANMWHWMVSTVVPDIESYKIQGLQNIFEPSTEYCTKSEEVYASCLHALRSNAWHSGKYRIHPLHNNRYTAIANLYCEWKSGRPTVVIGHDKGTNITVPTGNEAAYSTVIPFHYEVDDQMLEDIIVQSSDCFQYYIIHCKHVRLTDFASWTSRTGLQLKYFGGAHIENKGCDCGRNRTCAQVNTLCNCDINDYIWRADSGFFVDKAMLPVKEIKFGDLGHSFEAAYLVLGKLECIF